MMERHRTLIGKLIEQFRQSDPETELIETHISSVILTDGFAYKFKKPVDFGFLDFSTLEKREEYCREEVRINGRFASVLDYEVVMVGGTPEAPLLGTGPAIEYAVRMRRFDQADQLDRFAAAGRLTAGLIDRMAGEIAGMHREAPAAGAASDFGTPERVLRPVAENFALLEPFAFPRETGEKIARIREWSFARHEALKPFFEKRKKEGYIRECHGDLHLHNIALVEGEITPFDAIEFNPYFRWIDVISDLAFLLMDLDFIGETGLSNRLLNHYLDVTGDYAALRGLRFYQTYRAMVRVKVTALRLGQEGIGSEEKAERLGEIDRYLDLALDYTQTPHPFLALMHGLSGSGKSHAALFACGLSGGIRIRSDVERMRLFGPGVYTPEATRATYGRLAALASEIMGTGFSVFVDATFLKAWQRRMFEGTILSCRCDEETALTRIAGRQEAKSDISEADREVYFMQKKSAEPLSPAEQKEVVSVDCNSEASMDKNIREFVASLP